MSEITESDTVSTLAGRDELSGHTYPSWIEKIAFFGALAGAIWLGIWIFNNSGWPLMGQLPALICGLPVLTLAVTEAVGRIVQSFHAR